MAETWSPEHVLALAPDAAARAAATGAALPARWSAAGCDHDAVWGLTAGGAGEPYQVVVERTTPAFHCTCPSRKRPCKHALGLLLRWVNGQVAAGTRPPFAGVWLARRTARSAGAAPAREADPEPEAPPTRPPTRVRPGRPAGERPGPGDRRAAERAARTAAGLAELDRWLVDRLRTGLTDPSLARYATWEALAARLVDAQAGSLANRVKRLAGAVGSRPGWHEHVLAELGVLHLLASAGRRTPELPGPLAEGVRTAVGTLVRQADVLAGVPETDDWLVLGRSDLLEDRIVVRRTWLRGRRSEAWAMVLSFQAYGQALDGSLPVGTCVGADLHRYPGAVRLRALVGTVHRRPEVHHEVPPAQELASACAEVGRAVAEEPWLERIPITVRATPTPDGRRWVLADSTGSLPLAGPRQALPVLAACAGGRPVTLTGEWTWEGFVPLTLHGVEGAGGTVDVGPREGW